MFGKKEDQILVIKADSLAGFVAAEPVFDAIRRAHPGARISLLTGEPLQRVARASPYFDQVAIIPDLKDSVARTAFIKQLKTVRFACVYDLASDQDARRIQAGLGPFGPKWHSAVSPPAGRRSAGDPPQSRLPDLSRAMTRAGLDLPARRPDFSWALDARKDSANMKPGWFGINGPFGLLMPCQDKKRQWPAPRYSELALLMSRAGIMPVMVGGRDLHPFADQVAYDAPELVDLTGKADHLQLSALASGALFYVTDAAEEVNLAVAVGGEGVVIRTPAEVGHAPEGRQLLVLTHRDGLDRVEARDVWNALGNLGLLPSDARRTPATAR